MDEPKRGTVIHIGDTDIFYWTQNNPHIIFPELIVAAEELLYKNKDEMFAFQVENVFGRKKNSFDFFVRKKEVGETLSKAMAWAVEEEEYELCTRIKLLQEFIDKQNEF
tara:strand:+ start:148 stop:474 length:327 start_codon:yes stop_codon:yes gene_type:complete